MSDERLHHEPPFLATADIDTTRPENPHRPGPRPPGRRRDAARGASNDARRCVHTPPANLHWQACALTLAQCHPLHDLLD